MAGVDRASAAAVVSAALHDSIELRKAMLDSACIDQVVDIAEIMVYSLRAGGKVMFCGNGGSSSDAGHLAAELAGRFKRDRPPLAAVSLADATASVTAIANDYSYAEVFERQVRGLGRPGDVLVALSTSGRSPNVLAAMKAAANLGIRAVGLAGGSGAAMAEYADVCILVPSTDTARIQEACLHLGHSACELVELAMFAQQTGP